MGRPLGIEVEGALYQVMARGNAESDIFPGTGGAKSCIVHFLTPLQETTRT
jgi:hypothetical protein